MIKHWDVFFLGFVPVVISCGINPIFGIAVMIVLVIVCFVKPEWLGF